MASATTSRPPFPTIESVIDWIKDNIAQYGLTTIALGGLAALFFVKKLIKAAIFFAILAAVFAAGFLLAASRGEAALTLF